MKVSIDIRYPIIDGIRNGRRGSIVAVFEAIQTDLIELDVPEYVAVPSAPAFLIDAEAALSSMRMLHDPNSTTTYLGRSWMAVVENELSRPIRRIGPVLDHVYTGIVETHGTARTIQEQRALSKAIAKEVRGSVHDLAVFGDGRIYQADVVPVYEVKGIYSPSVTIVPSSTPKIASAQYFGPNERAEAEAWLRRMEMKAGIKEPYRMPMIMPAFQVPETEEEIGWALRDACRRVIAGLHEGVDSKYRDRWMDRVGGEGFASIVAAASAVLSNHDLDLETSTQVLADFSDILRAKLPPEDPTVEVVGILRARIDDARSLIRSRALSR